MEVRVTKMPKGNFVPEYKDEDGNFGPQWRECYLSNDLVARFYWTLEEAQEACREYAEKKKSENGEIVWTATL